MGSIAPVRCLLAVLTAAILGCASEPRFPADPQAPRPTFLTHEELRALFANTVTVHFAAYGQRGTGMFEKDGTARLYGGNWQEFGSWRIEGNRWCSRYPRAGGGCYNLHKIGDTSYRLYPTDGSPGGSSWEIQK